MGKMADNMTPGASNVTDPEQLRAYMEAIIKSVAAKTEHTDSALPALMLYHRVGTDRVEETCTIFDHLSTFTKNVGQDPVVLTEAVLPRAFIIRPENERLFRYYEKNLSRDFQVVRLPGMGTRPEDNKREAATQTLQEEKATSSAGTQRARRGRHKQVGIVSCHQAALATMTGVDSTSQDVLPKANLQECQPPAQATQELPISQVQSRMADVSSEVEGDDLRHSKADTQASRPDQSTFTMQPSGCGLQDREDAHVPASTPATYQEEEAQCLLSSQTPGYEDEPYAAIKEEVDIEVPAIDELVPYMTEEVDVKNIGTFTEDPLQLCEVRCKLFSQTSSGNCQLLTATEDKQRYSCSVCDSKFELKVTLKAHMLIHSGLRPYCCSICGRMFPLNCSLRNHMLIHSGERPHSCSVCNARFTTKGTLKGHMLTHTAVRRYSCSVCNKMLAQKTSLKNHMFTHFGQWPYCCSLCSSRFAFKCQLRNHLRTHSGIKPHSCSICNKRFAEKGQLNKHMFTHSDSKPFSCNECDRTFAKKFSLISHVKTHSKRLL